jgi:hypothetical protein
MVPTADSNSSHGGRAGEARGSPEARRPRRARRQRRCQRSMPSHPPTVVGQYPTLPGDVTVPRAPVAFPSRAFAKRVSRGLRSTLGYGSPSCARGSPTGTPGRPRPPSPAPLRRRGKRLDLGAELPRRREDPGERGPRHSDPGLDGRRRRVNAAQHAGELELDLGQFLRIRLRLLEDRGGALREGPRLVELSEPNARVTEVREPARDQGSVGASTGSIRASERS